MRARRYLAQIAIEERMCARSTPLFTVERHFHEAIARNIKFFSRKEHSDRVVGHEGASGGKQDFYCGLWRPDKKMNACLFCLPDSIRVRKPSAQRVDAVVEAAEVADWSDLLHQNVDRDLTLSMCVCCALQVPILSIP